MTNGDLSRPDAVSIQTQPARALESASRGWLAARQIPLAAAGATLVFYLFTTSGYGYFRDELYYLACAEHLDWGYVDQPPLIALITWLIRHTLGESLFALRLLPGVAGALTVYLTGRMAAVLGGGRFAQGLAALCAAVAPVYLVLFSLLTMNAFDILLWTIAITIVVRILNGGNPKLWLTFGLVVGIGLENKISVLFLGFGLVVGLVLDRQWRHLRSPWLWLGGVIAALLFAPHVWWQVGHGWPTLEFMANVQRFAIAPLSVFAFFGQQVVLLHPLAAPVWVAGVGFFLFARGGRPYRALGWMFLAVLAVMIAQRAKPYYPSAAYPAMLAAGGVVIERATAGMRARRLRPALVVLLFVMGALTAPLAKALLPPDAYVRYASVMPIETRNGQRSDTGPVWQIFADQFGWPKMVEKVAEVYRVLPAVERARVCIGASNFGEAGAIDFFGPVHGLPKAISTNESYWLWGPRDCDGSVMLLIGNDTQRDLEQVFERVTLAATLDCRYCTAEERHARIWICRGLREPIARIWAARKNF